MNSTKNKLNSKNKLAKIINAKRTLTVEKKGIFSFYDVGPTKISSKSWLFWAFQTHTNIPIPNC